MGELLRKGAHVGVGFFALLYAVLPPVVCLALAVLALVHNAILLPRYGRALWREQDHDLGYSPGVTAYSATLVILSLFYWNRPDVAAAGWGMLAFGDGLASLAGRAVGGRSLPWNRRKTWAGFLTFVFCGAAACFFLAGFVRRRVETLAGSTNEHLFLASFLAATVGAIVESLPLPWDDNLSAPLAAAAVFALVV